MVKVFETEPTSNLLAQIISHFGDLILSSDIQLAATY